MGEIMDVQGKEGIGILYFPLNFAVNLKWL